MKEAQINISFILAECNSHHNPRRSSGPMDVDAAAGQLGRTKLNGPNAWEIHPVSPPPLVSRGPPLGYELPARHRCR